MTDEKVIKTSEYFTYTAYADGTVTKTSRGDYEREVPLNTYTDDDGVFVWIGKNKYYIKSLIARLFLGGEYKRGCVIEHIDGNPANCAAINLRCVKRNTSRANKMYTKVSLDGTVYDSISAAERALFLSHGYLSKYFKGQIAGKALDGREVILVE